MYNVYSKKQKMLTLELYYSTHLETASINPEPDPVGSNWFFSGSIQEIVNSDP